MQIQTNVHEIYLFLIQTDFEGDVDKIPIFWPIDKNHSYLPIRHQLLPKGTIVNSV